MDRISLKAFYIPGRFSMSCGSDQILIVHDLAFPITDVAFLEFHEVQAPNDAASNFVNAGNPVTKASVTSLKSFARDCAGRTPGLH